MSAPPSKLREEYPPTLENLPRLVEALEHAEQSYASHRDTDYYDRMGPDRRSPALAALIGEIDDVAAIPSLVALLHRGGHQGSAALQAFARMGAAATPHLVAAYDTAASPDVRGRLMTAVAVSGGAVQERPDSRAAYAMIACLGAALWRARRPERDGPTNEADRLTWSALRPLLPLGDYEAHQRLTLLDAIAHVGDPAAAEPLKRGLADEDDEQVRGRIIDVLDALGDADAWHDAIEALEQGTRERRIGALDVLRRHVETGSSNEVFEALSARPDAWRGIITLSESWHAAKRFIEDSGDHGFDALAERARSDDEAARRNALDLLGKIDSARARDLLHTLLESKPPADDWWMDAFESLVQQRDPRALDWARSLEDHGVARLRVRALFARTTFGDETALAPIVSAIAENAPRGATLLRNLLLPDGNNPRSDALTQAAREALVGSPDALRAFVERAADRQPHTLALLGEAVVPAILHALTAGAPESPHTLVLTLGRIGDPRAIETLRELLRRGIARRPAQSACPLNAIWETLLSLGDASLIELARAEITLPPPPTYGEPWMREYALRETFEAFGEASDIPLLQAAAGRLRREAPEDHWWVGQLADALESVAATLSDR